LHVIVSKAGLSLYLYKLNLKVYDVHPLPLNATKPCGGRIFATYFTDI